MEVSYTLEYKWDMEEWHDISIGWKNDWLFIHCGIID